MQIDTMFQAIYNFGERIYTKLIKGSHHDIMPLWQGTSIPNPHKIMGFAALSHFLYRYWLAVTTGSMHFSRSPWNLLYLVGHMSLSCSSFLFPVKKTRNFTNQIIWRELQLHNIVFTARSCFIFAYEIYYPNQYIWTRFVIVMSCHIAADVITHYYKEGSTIRDTCCDNILVTETVKPYLDKFYAFSQFTAIIALIVPRDCTLESTYMVMFVIQLSTFLMTLRLKGIINNDGWHVFYTLSLLMNFQVAEICYNHEKPHYFIFFVSLFYMWRICLRGNKYLGWFLVISFYNIFMNLSRLNSSTDIVTGSNTGKRIYGYAVVPYYEHQVYNVYM